MSIFSDPRIIKLLQSGFVAYAGECQEVYRRASPLPILEDQRCAIV